MYHIQGKKRANSRTYGKFIASYDTEKEILAALTPEEIRGATSPYVFTHIQLPAERVITQTVQVGDRDIVCSPSKLWDEIQAAQA